MSISRFSLAEAAIGQGTSDSARTKTPPKRQVVALADATVVPEPR